MSGHSKWSSIKHKKAATDAKRGKLFTKLTRSIIVAAKEGGGDPSGNASLQAAIDKGQRDVSMLNENSALGRMVSPEEVARAVCFLASEDASAITGANLPVDCGWLVAPSWHTYGGLRQPGNA